VWVIPARLPARPPPRHRSQFIFKTSSIINIIISSTHQQQEAERHEIVGSFRKIAVTLSGALKVLTIIEYPRAKEQAGQWAT
jgi:hypothetical protein